MKSNRGFMFLILTGMWIALLLTIYSFMHSLTQERPPSISFLESSLAADLEDLLGRVDVYNNTYIIEDYTPKDWAAINDFKNFANYLNASVFYSNDYNVTARNLFYKWDGDLNILFNGSEFIYRDGQNATGDCDNNGTLHIFVNNYEAYPSAPCIVNTSNATLSIQPSNITVTFKQPTTFYIKIITQATSNPYHVLSRTCIDMNDTNPGWIDPNITGQFIYGTVTLNGSNYDLIEVDIDGDGTFDWMFLDYDNDGHFEGKDDIISHNNASIFLNRLYVIRLGYTTCFDEVVGVKRNGWKVV